MLRSTPHAACDVRSPRRVAAGPGRVAGLRHGRPGPAAARGRRRAAGAGVRGRRNPARRGWSITGSQAVGPVRRLTVHVYPREEAQSIVRAEAEFLDPDMREPRVLRRFFEALSLAMYLTGHEA
ncbi:MAG: hypothetical protein MZU95_10830 [Desulfomicrobium escambiense]|nr:hypothetical protein [Desulfomicrobium escambiense]